MWEKGDGGDGDGPIAAVSDYVELLRLGLIQQAADERISWLESQFKGLVRKKSKDGKPSVVGIAQFLKLPIGHPGGGGAETGRVHIQHHKQVDWRSAGVIKLASFFSSRTTYFTYYLIKIVHHDRP